MSTEIDLRDHIRPASTHPDFAFSLPPPMVRAILVDVIAEGVTTSLLNASAGLRKADWIAWATAVVDLLEAEDLVPHIDHDVVQ